MLSYETTEELLSIIEEGTQTTDNLGVFVEENDTVLYLTNEGASYHSVEPGQAIQMELFGSYPVYYSGTDMVSYSKRIYKAIDKDIYLDIDYERYSFGVWDRIPDADEFWAEIAQPIADDFCYLYSEEIESGELTYDNLSECFDLYAKSKGYIQQLADSAEKLIVLQN